MPIFKTSAKAKRIKAAKKVFNPRKREEMRKVLAHTILKMEVKG